VVDLDVVRRQYVSLTTALPGTEVFYAVKANPAPEVLSLLIKLGSNFDVASRGEIELCLGLGAVIRPGCPMATRSRKSVISPQHTDAASGSLPSTRSPSWTTSCARWPAARCSSASSPTVPGLIGRCRGSLAARWVAAGLAASRRRQTGLRGHLVDPLGGKALGMREPEQVAAGGAAGLQCGGVQRSETPAREAGPNFLVRSRSVYINRGESVSAQPFGTRGPPCRSLLHSGTAGASVGRVRLVPDVDYGRMPADLRAGERADPDAAGEWLARAWTASYRSQVSDSMLLEFEDVATFLFDQASGAGAVQADRTIAAWGFARSARRPRDAAYQRGYPSPAGRAERPLDRGHMVAHSAGGEFGPNIFPQDRALNRGWSAEGKRYRALEREIAGSPEAFFFCCLLYADDSDFPAAVELGLLRPSGLHVERFVNRFDLR
jgi:hypothetical protein